MKNVYAEVGQHLQQVGGRCPAGWVVMAGQRPTPEHVAQADGTWVLPAATPTHFIELAQDLLDSKAQSYGYDDIRSAVTYAEEPSVPKFQEEGKAFRTWRSLVWAHCYALLDQVQNGGAVPSDETFLADLPKLSLIEVPDTAA